MAYATENCECGIEELKLSPESQEEIERLRGNIERHDESIKDKREAISSINSELVSVQERIIVDMATVIDRNAAKKDRQTEINDEYQNRDWNYAEIGRIRERERNKQRSESENK